MPKTAIVTGGAGGLGLAVAKSLRERDYEVVVFDVSEEKIASLEQGIIGKKVDITEEEAVVRAVEDVVQTVGPVHVLVNNAGTIFSEPLLNFMRSDQIRHNYTAFKQNIEINLCAAFLVTSVVAETMAKKRIQGSIINISSICAQGNAGQSSYSAAKAGLEALTKVWSKELGPLGIRANAIAPGFIDAESTRQALGENRIKELISRTPLRRFGAASDIALAVNQLLDNPFINGAVIPVNGGLAL